MRILIVEDEADLNQVLVKHLKNNGYAVDSCMDGEEAWDYLEAADYDLVVLDIMLPGCDGMTLLSRARRTGLTMPVLLLTARDAVEDKVKGLDAGADDYLTKPFALEELLARVRMLLRKKTGTKTSFYQVADLKVDLAARSVERGGREIVLSAKEFALLQYFLLHQGQVLSRRQIEDHLWDFSYEGASNMVDVYVRYLRKKIDEGYDQKLIHTVRGAGYLLKV